MLYKLYFLDPSGRTNRASDCDYDGDELAILGANEERGNSDAELWRGHLMVAKFRRTGRHYL